MRPTRGSCTARHLARSRNLRRVCGKASGAGVAVGALRRLRARRGRSRKSAEAREFGAIVESARSDGEGITRRSGTVHVAVHTGRHGATGRVVQRPVPKTTSPETAGELLERRSRIDVSALLPHVTMPTLVLHARNDVVVPLAEGRLIAARIPSAQFVELDSKNHILLEHESAWERFRAAVSEFAGLSVAATLRIPRSRHSRNANVQFSAWLPRG